MNTKFNIGEVVYVLNSNAAYKGTISEIHIEGNAKAPKINYNLRAIGRFEEEHIYKTFELLAEALKVKVDGN